MKIPVGKIIAWGGWIVAAATALGVWIASHPHP